MRKLMKSFWSRLTLSLFFSLGAWATAIAIGETLPPSSPTSEAPQATGEEIIRKSNQLIDKIGDQRNKVMLSLIEKTGVKKGIVAWRYWKNYHNQDGFWSKTIIFQVSSNGSPRANFLIWNYATPGKAADMWLYLPALLGPRYKPCLIRSLGQTIQNRCQPGDEKPFIDSDLTFGDELDRQIDEDSHQRVGEESFRGVVCFVVESIPKEKETVYSKKRIWISESDYTVQKIDYYDRNDKLLKRQTIDWQILKEKEGEIYVWKKSEIVNLQNGHQTILEVSDLDVNIGLIDKDFTEQVLKESRKSFEEHLEARSTRKPSGQR